MTIEIILEDKEELEDLKRDVLVVVDNATKDYDNFTELNIAIRKE